MTREKLYETWENNGLSKGKAARAWQYLSNNQKDVIDIPDNKVYKYLEYRVASIKNKENKEINKTYARKLLDESGFNKGEIARAWQFLVSKKGREDNVTIEDVNKRISYMRNVLKPCKKYKISLYSVKMLSKDSGLSEEKSTEVLIKCKEMGIPIPKFMRLRHYAIYYDYIDHKDESKNIHCSEESQLKYMYDYLDHMRR